MASESHVAVARIQEYIDSTLFFIVARIQIVNSSFLSHSG